MTRWFMALLFGISFASVSTSEDPDQERPSHPSQENNEANPTKNLPFPLLPPSPDLSHIKILEVPLERGVKAWLVRSVEAPVISLNIVLRGCGSRAKIPNKAGVERLVLAMTDEGAGEMDSRAFKRFLIENNIDFTSDSSLDIAVLSLRFPKTSITQGFQALKLIISHLNFNEDTLKDVKQRLKVSYRQALEDDGNIINDAISSTLVKNTVYEHSTKQALADIDKITSEDLKNFYKEYFTIDRLIVGVCGDITEGELKNYINTAFQDMPEKSSSPKPSPISPQNLGSRTNIPIDVPQSTVAFAHPFVSRADPDFYAMDIALDIFGAGDFEARLMKSIRVNQGLAYGAVAEPLPAELLSMVYGSASTRTQTVEKVVSLIRNEWDTFITKGATPEEVSNAKEKNIAQFALRLSSTPQVASVLCAIQYHNLGIDFLQKRKDIISALTTEQINTAIKKHLSSDKLTFFVGGRELQPSTLPATSKGAA